MRTPKLLGLSDLFGAMVRPAVECLEVPSDALPEELQGVAEHVLAATKEEVAKVGTGNNPASPPSVGSVIDAEWEELK